MLLAPPGRHGARCYPPPVTLPSASDADPACPERVAAAPDAPSAPIRPLETRRTTLEHIERSTWDALAARTPWSTPFSRWSFHRAWWDAYAPNAHDETLVVVDATAAAPGGIETVVAIAPLMHRHEVEPTDAATHTALRRDGPGRMTPVAPTAKAVFFGAAYHADYATILSDPADLPSVAAALAAALAAPATRDDPHPDPWDVVDLRRLRCGDPAADAVVAAMRARAATEGWRVAVEREDVCPVVTLPDGGDFDDYLATLGKKERHEIRRKVRRAEAAGEVRLDPSPDPLADLDAFIDLHQKRWGARGLFPPTEGGAMSRRFFERLFELTAPEGILDLRFLTVGGRRIAAGVGFDDGQTMYYFNAGIEPEARELSPGVVMVERYMRTAIARGRRRLDFLRGDEPYKYEWGAIDEPIQRVLVTRA
jgi:CelD/BcsL family acetyltransferase involved in cellulose biosynthesis